MSRPGMANRATRVVGNQAKKRTNDGLEKGPTGGGTGRESRARSNRIVSPDAIMAGGGLWWFGSAEAGRRGSAMEIVRGMFLDVAGWVGRL